MNLALPWSGLDYWSQMAQADHDWACQCQGKLAVSHTDLDLAGRDLVLALSVFGPDMVGPRM